MWFIVIVSSVIARDVPAAADAAGASLYAPGRAVAPAELPSERIALQQEVPINSHFRADPGPAKVDATRRRPIRPACPKGPVGFEVISCEDGLQLRALPGDWVHGSVEAAEANFVKLARLFMERHGISFSFDVGSEGLHPEHLVPLLHVLPGKLISLQGADRDVEEVETLLPPQIRSSVTAVGPEDLALLLGNSKHTVVTLRDAPLESLAQTSPQSRSSLGLSSNEFDWVANRQIVFLARDDSESHLWNYYWDMERDADAGDDNSEVLRNVLSNHVVQAAARPFQDMQFSRYMRSNKYASQGAVLDYTKSQMAAVHHGSPCQQGGCKGVVLVVVSATMDRDRNGGCTLDRGALTKMQTAWNVVISLDPDCNRPKKDPPHVYMNHPNDGLSIAEIVDFADVVITFSSEAIPSILGTHDGMPMVRIVPEQRKFSLLQFRVFNASMGQVIRTLNEWDVLDELDAAVAQMENKGQRERVLGARKEYVKRYWWYVDGYEEYRVALQLLSLAAPDATSDEFVALHTALTAFTTVPPRPLHIYRANHPVSQPFFTADARNDFVWQSVKKAFWPA